MKTCKRVAIVGGGFSGLGVIKSFKDDGIEPVCFEKSSNIGGTWCYRPEAVFGIPSIMSTTTINHSKEMGAFSFHPYPRECPNYMRHQEIYRAMMEMAEKYDLLKHITCNREVVGVQRADDYAETGRWVVTTRNAETGETIANMFDGVVVCAGQFGCPKVPSYPGMDKFAGRIIHTHGLKTFESFAGQRVVVVGTGCSALDAAVEISDVASQVYLSVRTPSWILPRLGPHGLPMDYVIHRRYIYSLFNIIPISWSSKMIEYLFLNNHFNHHLYGIHPKYPLLCRDPIINDMIPLKLLSGSVVLRNDITTIEENGVQFEEESKLTKVDTIVMATGYDPDFSFLEDEILIEREKGKFLLYKCVFPPHLKHHTLAFVGFILPFGPGFPIGEIQTRWISFVMSGKGTLPSREIMMKDIDRRYEENASRYSPSDKMSLRVDSVPYMDEIASQFGARPKFWKMALTDPKLFMACMLGPAVPYQYRLVGPHKWDGAREAILTAPQRMTYPLRRKQGKIIGRKKRGSSSLAMLALFVAVVVLALSWESMSLKWCLLILILFYILPMKSMMTRCLLVLLLLPIGSSLKGYTYYYMIGLCVPLLIARVLRIY